MKDLNGIIERVGDTEVLSDEREIDAGFTARDAIAALDEEGRIRVLSWIAGALDIPVTVAQPCGHCAGLRVRKHRTRRP